MIPFSSLALSSLSIKITSFFLFTFSLVVGAESFQFLESKLMSLDTAGPPEQYSGNIILTYRSQSGWPIRHVAARFEHENFKVLHTYTRNDNGVFFLVFSAPEDCTCLKYRIVVDGLWMKDPFNPHTDYGGLFCLFTTSRQSSDH